MSLLKHSCFYLLARGLPGIINLLALGFYTRLLAPDSYGQYALVIAAVGLADLIFFQWLRVGVLRFFCTYKGEKEVFLSTIMVGFVGLVVLTGFVGIIALFFIVDPVLQGLVSLGVCLLWFQAFFEINMELARSQLKPMHYGFLALTKALIALGVGGGLAYLGFGAIGLLVGSMLGMIFSVLCNLRENWKGISLNLGRAEIFHQLLDYGLPLTATFSLGFVVSSSDRFLLGWLLGVETSGLYSVGYDLAQHSLGMLMMIINLAAYPLAVHALEERGKDAATVQLKQNAIVLLSVALPSATGFALLSPNIAEVVLGESFSNTAAELMPWISFSALVGGVKSYYFDLSFQLGRNTMGQVWVVLAAAIINILLNLYLIPRVGLIGAAYSTLLAYAVGLILSWWLGRRVFKLPLPIKDSCKIAMATAGMAICLTPFAALRGGWALVCQILFGGGIFVFLLLVMNVGGGRKRLSQLMGELCGNAS